MSESAKSSKPPADQPKKENKSDLILTPISIARARHASAHGPSIINKSDQDSTAKSKESKRESKKSSAALTSGRVSKSYFSVGPNSCLVLIFICFALIVGGIIGGVMGGSLMLWASNSGQVAFVDSTVTPSPSPTFTPMPVETTTPTPTLFPAATVTIEDKIASVIPSVVTVINQHQNNFVPGAIYDEGRVVGSGVIVDARGYIATNNHVVDTPRNLRVVLADGREVVAELVAANPASDLAILKIELIDLPVIQWGDSGLVRPGQAVYAIGSPLGDFPSSVSFGIVSGLNRALEIDKYVIDGLIQTDAAINRGSSGGPLINIDGEVVGINTFIIRESEERGIAEGIAFAIPATTAKGLLIPWIAAHKGESVPIPASEGAD
jgi:S1-C subfamily serine protease